VQALPSRYTYVDIDAAEFIRERRSASADESRRAKRDGRQEARSFFGKCCRYKALCRECYFC